MKIEKIKDGTYNVNGKIIVPEVDRINYLTPAEYSALNNFMESEKKLKIKSTISK